MLGDGTCQSACYNEACNWDKTDCSSLNCSPQCTPTLQFNFQCDQECNSALCNYDESRCFCAIGCSPDLLGNSICDPACDNVACALDHQDCVSATQGYCASQCFASMLGDGTCNEACNNSACNNDMNDCCRSSCSGKEGTCDRSCLHPDCGYDPTCPDQFLRDAAYYFQSWFQNFEYEWGLQNCYYNDWFCNEFYLRPLYDGNPTWTNVCQSQFCLQQLGYGLDCDPSMHWTDAPTTGTTAWSAQTVT
jgi:hypothetical protein